MIEYRQYLINRLRQEGVTNNSSFVGVIYGTGVGACELYEALGLLGINENIIAFVDQNTELKMLYHRPVIGMESVLEKANVIFVGARYSYEVVEERIRKVIKKSNERGIRIINVFKPNNSIEDKEKYLKFLENKILRKSGHFVPYMEKGISLSDDDSKIIAWYLPQYYPIDVNDEFHGLGFTEWTNVSQAYPQYEGHYQPHIPYDVGFYDLRDKNTILRQAFLAKHYGIYGFCVHYYWFDGKKLLDEPLKLILNNPYIDIHYCLNWATEDWTMAWDDGYERLNIKKTIIKQNLPEHPQEFMRDIIPYMHDRRYIKVDGKPVLSIYKCDVFSRDRFCETMEAFRRIAKTEGFPDLYIMITTGSGFDEDCKLWNADALVEYQPNLMFQSGELKRVFPEGYINPNYRCNMLDVTEYLDNRDYLKSHNSEAFYRCAVTSWDNTARKGKSGGVLYTGLTPNAMKIWLKELMMESKKIHSPEKDMVFLSSWNEWAEGSHLEPDMEYGYSWLQAVTDALEEVRRIH